MHTKVTRDGDFFGATEYTLEGHKRACIVVFWQPITTINEHPRVTINWTSLGIASVTTAEAFRDALAEAIEEAKEKGKEIGAEE